MNKGKLSPEKEKDYWLSTLEFKDPLIEEKFQVEAQQSVLWLGKVVILEVMFFNLVDICFEIHDTVVFNQDKTYMAGIVLINVLVQTIIVALFFLSKRYIKLSKIFNALATLVIVVGITERNMLDGEKTDSGDSYISIIGLVSPISFLGNCQLSLLASYACSMIYIFIRQYYFTGGDYTFWLRGSNYCMVTFILMFILARFNVAREREKYRLQRQSNQLSHLFHTFMRVYHDGILLSHGENIIY